MPVPQGGRVGYFDCYSGASGDMILGAMVDAGLDVASLRHQLGKLDVAGYELTARRVVRSGLAGTQVRVQLENGPQPARSLEDIERVIGSSALPLTVRERALMVFANLAAAEAAVHGIPIHEVHFHELGAVDAIVDVVGAAIGVEELGLDAIFASSLPLGRGMVTTAHGQLPLPAPATLALLASARAPTRPADIDAELVTPTGAALLTSFATFDQPPMTLERVGIGFGARELPWPNALRLWVGSRLDSSLETDEVAVIETNLDDCVPEQIGFAMDRLMEVGALDVFLTPVQMKKNRPGVLMTVLGAPARAQELARVLLRETTSLGVRFRTGRRLICPRRTEIIHTRYGAMQVKIKSIDGRDIVCPEYEECARIARERNLPIGEVYTAVFAAAWSAGD